MKFYGDEIGDRPTMTQVEVYIAEKGMSITPKQVFEYWDKKDWLTNKGVPVKTLEAAINVVNGIFVNKYIHQNECQSLSKKEKKKLLLEKIHETKRKAKEIAYENNQPKPYSKYEDQLKDEKWSAFRQFIFKIRGRKCETCGAEDHLQVHHTIYRNVKAWEYTCNDVIVVCRDCHKQIHKIKY